MTRFGYTDEELIKAFHKESVKNNKYKLYCKRDNCGPAVLDFIDFAKSYRVYDIERVSGFFEADNFVHSFKDLTPEEHQMMKKEGLDPKLDKDRITFIQDNKIETELRFIPHYWAVRKGKILDVVGDCQFIKTGLARDIKPYRYHQKAL